MRRRSLLLVLLMAGLGTLPLLVRAALAPPTDVTPVLLATATRPDPLQVTVLNVLPAASAVHFSAEALGGALPVEGTYQVLGGTVTLEEQRGQRRIRAQVLIDTPSVTVGTGLIDDALRAGMETALYPVATFDGVSTDFVPLTEEPIHFVMDGTLHLHGRSAAVTMHIGPATVVGEHLEAQAAMDINLGDFGITFPEGIVSPQLALAITLIADASAPESPPAAAGE